MTVCIVEMPSYTYAVKSEKLLKSRGFPCEIKRNENASAGSCGYSLYVYRDSRRAVEILDKYAVPYTNIVYGGA
ncbi:MAG: DUF3343 domain-containing protein [Ruminococcus sp.]|nr:DUF3343 domain-containing protein [Ruminococcus sp.]